MFEPYFKTIIERLYGRKLPALLADIDVVPERTLRSWLDGSAKPRPGRQADFERRCRATLEGHVASTDWTQGQRDAYLADVAGNPGAASALVHIVHWRGAGGCPAALELARRIDSLSTALARCRCDDDSHEYVRLFDTDWLTDAHFEDPDRAAEAWVLRAGPTPPVTWAALIKPTAVLLFNLQLQLLATLDHEFAMRYLPAFVPAPIFAGLIPDHIRHPTGAGRSRGTIRLPARRLLHMLGCMRHFRVHRRWPARAPAVEDVAKWMAVSASELAKWRMGRRFTIDDFDHAWIRMFEILPTADRPGTPTPLMFASVMLTRLLVVGTHERRDVHIASGAAPLYLAWWERQRAVAEAFADMPRDGTVPWMPGLL